SHEAPLRIATLRSLTTGKAAAQVAHAAWRWFLNQTGGAPEPWFTLSFVSPSEIRALSTQPGALPVRDAGFTEVAPGTVTAVAFADPRGYGTFNELTRSLQPWRISDSISGFSHWQYTCSSWVVENSQYPS